MSTIESEPRANTLAAQLRNADTDQYFLSGLAAVLRNKGDKHGAEFISRQAELARMEKVQIIGQLCEIIPVEYGQACAEPDFPRTVDILNGADFPPQP